MPDGRGPSVRARQLARELRRLRTEQGLTGEQVASELGWSSAKISRLEMARTAITVADLRRLLTRYDAGDTTVERLTELARKARERGWWEAYVDSFDENYATFISLEDDATFMHCYHMNVVNGLLQTERYARAIITSGGPKPHGELERRIRVRLTRQKRLYEGDALHVWAVLDEATLRRNIGGDEVMHEQLGHLIEMAEAPNITLQTLPYEAGAHSSLPGSFVIFGFEHPDDPRVVALETLVGNLIIEDDVQVFRHILTFDELREKALSPEESKPFISRIARDYQR